MKASDSHPQFPSKVREYTNFAVRGITKICKEIGPRPCGSEAERKAQEYMMNEWKTCADEAHLEEFETHPGAFMGWFKIDAVLLVIAIILSILGLPQFALIPIAIAIIILGGEFLFYRELTDVFYPKKTSCNTVAVRKAAGETKRRIIFAGHIDSSYEWRPTYYGGKVLLFATFGYAIVGLVYLLVISIVGLILPEENSVVNILQWVSLAFVPAFIFLFFFLSGKTVAQGANDNLTGVFAGAAVMKYMADNDLRFENTELVCIATGGEESGLRGAKAYMKAHAEEIKSSGIETVFIAVDTLRDYETQAVYAKDMSGITKHDKRACHLLKKAGELCGLKMEFSSVYAGASDAAAVTQAGVPATCYAAMDPGPPRYYHTRLDTWDNMDRKTIEKGVEVLINTAYLFDEKGLCASYD